MTVQRVAKESLVVDAEERPLALSVGALGLPALLCTEAGWLVAINTQATRLLDGRAVAGYTLADLALTSDQGDITQDEWRRQCAPGKGWSCQAQMIGAEGKRLDVQLLATPVDSYPTEAPLWLVILQDITESVIHVRELEIYAKELNGLFYTNRQQLRKLQEIERSRDLFYSLVTHELKTPLTSLKAGIEMLGLPELALSEEPRTRALLESMGRSAIRLEKMINDLLDLATAKSGGLKLVTKQVDMLDVIRAVCAEMGPLAAEKGIEIVGPSRGRRPLDVEGDETRLQQVVQNLISNAIKAAPRRGSVLVRARRLTSHARVTVINPGVTLDASVAKELFEPFRKSSANGYKAGAGLGLAVVDALVRAHHGSISVAPRPGRVNFSFTIPLWKAT